ncbi:hypothetical protein JNUCC64_01760 [Streptomyces sp. JNUCC 64]
MLTGHYTEAVGRDLFRAVAELTRVVAWADIDMGRHDRARHHLDTALRAARAAGDAQTICYVQAPTR